MTALRAGCITKQSSTDYSTRMISHNAKALEIAQGMESADRQGH